MNQRLVSIGMCGAAVLATAVFAAPVATAAAKLEVKPTKPFEGDAVLVTVRGMKTRPAGSALGKDLLFYGTVGGAWQAVFAVPLEDAPPKLDVVVQQSDLRTTLEVRPRAAIEDEVKVDPMYAEPPADKIKQTEEDNQAVVRALKNVGPPQFKSRFGKAGLGRITSAFGGWRTFNGSHRSRHLGFDLAARKGAAVKSINAGTVTLVADTFLMGKVVVIDHGGGIGSTFFHLRDVAVAQGDKVRRGQRIGGAGDGGRTNGSHLHLGLWVAGGFVDPAAFARLPLLTPRPADSKAAN